MVPTVSPAQRRPSPLRIAIVVLSGLVLLRGLYVVLGDGGTHAAGPARRPPPFAAATLSPLPAAQAHGPALPLAEILARAGQAEERRPQKQSCTVDARAFLLDAEGLVKEEQRMEMIESWSGGTPARALPHRRFEGERELSAQELAEANAEEQKKRADLESRQQRGDGEELSPIFAQKGREQLAFTLSGEELVDGRRCFRLTFAPRPGVKGARAGTAWVDAETFTPLLVKSAPSPLPEHVERMELTEEFFATAQGETAPHRLQVEGRGGILFLKRNFRLDTEWRDCK